MKKLKLILLAYILASIVSCYCDDCSATYENYPAYANKSGEIVKIVTIGEDYNDDWFIDTYYYEKIIAKNDTLHSYADTGWGDYGRDCGFVSFGDCNKPIRMELHFLNKPQKCLVFDGPIKHDKFDMRSWKSYKKGKEINELRADYWLSIEYVYTITPEHKAMAKEDYCL
ncbi:MAG: hypothetical protein FWF63_04375 [Fibromonadales bacterium]|nr:hypothetical protein [Fibromonadales bacterium]